MNDESKVGASDRRAGGGLTRRGLLAALGLGAVAGCLGPGSPERPSPGVTTGTPPTDEPSPRDDGGVTLTPDGEGGEDATSTAEPDPGLGDAEDADGANTEDTDGTTTSAPVDEAVRVLYLYGAVDADGDLRGEDGYDGDPFHQMRLGDSGPLGMSKLAAAIRELGVDLEERYDGSLIFDAEALGAYDVLWLGSSQRRVTDAERRAVGAWVRDGGGIVAYSDSALGGDYRLVGVDNTTGADARNRLLSGFGLQFFTDQGASGGDNLVTDWRVDHYLNTVDGRPRQLRFRGEGTSPIRIDPDWPERRAGDRVYQVARHQHGGAGGPVTVDGGYDPKRDCAVCVAEVGDGRVVATFDRNTFWNAGTGTDITEHDNRRYAQKLVAFAAGREDLTE